jgi:hypothetical protein
MVDDGWDNYTRGAGSLDPLVRGRPVVFKDGEYFVDGEPLAPGGQYVVLRLIERWTKWPEGQPPEHVVAGPGERRLRREELGDTNEKLWKPSKYNTRERVDPWKDGRNLWLMDAVSGELLTFQTESGGGRLAVEKLGDQTKHERANGQPSAVPVVALETADYGATTRPRLAVTKFLPSAPANLQLEPLKLPPRKQLPPPTDDQGGNSSPIDDDIPF